MAKRMPKIGGTYLQAESEVAAINMVLGAASAGVRVMTSSSSPGISLKTEGISYIAGSDLPCLIINVQRGGPGLSSLLRRTIGRLPAPPVTAIFIFWYSRLLPFRKWWIWFIPLMTRRMNTGCLL